MPTEREINDIPEENIMPYRSFGLLKRGTEIRRIICDER